MDAKDKPSQKPNTESAEATSRRHLLSLGGASLGALFPAGCVRTEEGEHVGSVPLALDNSKLDVIETLDDLEALGAPGTADTQAYVVLGHTVENDGGEASSS